MIRIRWCGGSVLLAREYSYPYISITCLAPSLALASPLCWGSSGYWRVSVDTVKDPGSPGVRAGKRELRAGLPLFGCSGLLYSRVYRTWLYSTTPALRTFPVFSLCPHLLPALVSCSFLCCSQLVCQSRLVMVWFA